MSETYRARGKFVSDSTETIAGMFCIQKGKPLETAIVAVTWDKETQLEIVNALNAMPALRVACELALAELGNLADQYKPKSNGCIARASEALKQAIAKAKGVA